MEIAVGEAVEERGEKGRGEFIYPSRMVALQAVLSVSNIFRFRYLLLR